MSFDIIAAQPAHVAAVQAIYGHWVRHGLASFEEAVPDAEEIDRRRQAIQAAGLPYLVALAGDDVIGYGYAALYRTRSAYRYSVEDSVYVAPEALSCGAGRALLTAIIAEAERLGYHQMLAVIGDSANAASIGLHQRLGFRRVGTLTSVGFKFGRWVDTVLMQRALGAGDSELPAR
jgi:L-amino acid N-acyltransferase YncA